MSSKVRAQGADKTGRAGLFAVLLMAAGEFVGNYAQYQLSPISLRIMEQFELSASAFSGVYSAPMIPSIVLGIVAGSICDKAGAKRVVGIGLLITALGTLLRIFAQSYAMLYISMVMIGFSFSFLNTCVGKIAGAWFPKERVGTMVGVVFAGSSLGMVLGSSTTALLPSVSLAFCLSCGAAVVITAAWFIFMKDRPSNSPLEAEIVAPMKESLLAAAKSRTVWLAGGIAAAMIGCNMVVAGFLPQALQSRGISERAAGLLSSVMTAGCLLGTLLGPRVTERMSKKTVLTAVTALVAVGSACGWLLPVIGIALAMLIVGASLGTMFAIVMSLPVYDEGLGVRYAGSASGVITTVEMLGAVVIPTYIVTPIAGTNFVLMFILGGVCALLGTVCARLLPDM